MEVKDSLTLNNPNKLNELKKYKDIIVMFLISRVVFGLFLFIFNNFDQAMNLFDGNLYRRIAEYGYDDIALTAFFPFIPILIHFTGTIGLFLINQFCFIGSLYILKKLNVNSVLLVAVAFSPVGFFSMLLYTESIFFFLTVSAYYVFVNKKSPLLLGILLGLSVFTRSTGSALFFAIFIVMFIMWIKKSYSLKNIIITYVPATIISLIYPVFLQVKFGKWYYFVNVQYDYWVRIKSNLVNTIICSMKMVFTDEYPFLSEEDKLLGRLNESISLILFFILLTAVVYSIVKMFRTRKLNLNELVLDLYVLLNLVALNATIRDPFLDAPTISFFRYYYQIFAMYLLIKNAKPMVQRLFLYFTLLLSIVTSISFSMGIFFY